jgi:hypothetical protein
VRGGILAVATITSQVDGDQIRGHGALLSFRLIFVPAVPFSLLSFACVWRQEKETGRLSKKKQREVGPGATRFRYVMSRARRNISVGETCSGEQGRGSQGGH